MVQPKPSSSISITSIPSNHVIFKATVLEMPGAVMPSVDQDYYRDSQTERAFLHNERWMHGFYANVYSILHNHSYFMKHVRLRDTG
ncbi:hypothetical protein FRC03_009022 [Tulasnella sp. 419]|nr:hypothetical protein FRC03_009022 [Tulasnella sp. 419]